VSSPGGGRGRLSPRARRVRARWGWGDEPQERLEEDDRDRKAHPGVELRVRVLRVRPLIVAERLLPVILPHLRLVRTGVAACSVGIANRGVETEDGGAHPRRRVRAEWGNGVGSWGDYGPSPDWGFPGGEGPNGSMCRVIGKSCKCRCDRAGPMMRKVRAPLTSAYCSPAPYIILPRWSNGRRSSAPVSAVLLPPWVISENWRFPRPDEANGTSALFASLPRACRKSVLRVPHRVPPGMASAFAALSAPSLREAPDPSLGIFRSVRENPRCHGVN